MASIRSNIIKRSWAPALIAVLICLYPPLAFSEMADMVKFEIAKKYFRQGTVHFNRMRYLAAAEYFRKAVREYPDYYTARDHMARAYKLAGFTDSALKEWENLSEMSPDNVAVTSKIENLRFQDTLLDRADDSPEYVLYETYKSSDYNRFRFNNPVDIAVDNEKNIYITSFHDGSLVKIDSNGKGVFSIRTSIDSRLYGIDYRAGRLAVTDFKKDRVYIMGLNGEVRKRFGASGNNEGEFHGPEGLCFNSKGELYVVDSGNSRVQKFDDAGTFILQFGKKGEYEGELSRPTDVAVYRDRVYVTDTGNRRIACFDDSGNFIENITVDGVESPRGIVRSGETLMVSDEKGGLLWFNPSNGSASRLSADAKGNSLSKLMAAVSDRDGYLYCLDYSRQAVALFSPAHKQYSNVSLEITSVDLGSFPVVAFYVNVRNRDGSPLYGLDKTNFTVTEDSALITNLYTDYLKRLAPSVSIALCVDRSVRAEDHHGDLPWTAEFILQKMRKNDSLEVLNFNSETWIGNKFDWSRRRALRALRERDYAEGKNVGKALYDAVGDLVPRLNRRGVVLVTDGSVDDNSFRSYTPTNIIRFARSHYIPIYIISFKEPHELLRSLASETGGAIFRPRDVDGLRSIYSRIKNSEEYRYVLVYSTFKLRSFAGWWSDVKIEVNHKGQKGVEWGGYFVP
ncbi:MAG TPA: VWA domain-containing protein [Spirochaetota bacterium]|nr:VWA domain-containing protein [Spirochaetota bacterium]